MKLRSLLILCFFLLNAGLILTQEKNDDSNYKPAAFSFTVFNNKIILPVKVDSQEQMRIILDSGMGWDGLLIYNPEVKGKLDLKNPQSANLGGAGQGNSQPALVADSMSFFVGSTEFINQKIIVLQTDHFKGFPSDGVTGYSLFGHYAVEVNFDDSTITLFDPDKIKVDSSWAEFPIYFKDNSIPWIDVGIKIAGENPVSLSCYIDCASSESIELLTGQNQKFIIPKETENVHLGRGLSGDIYGKRGKITEVILGSFKINNIQAAFTPAQVRSKQSGADGVIAGKLLRRFNLIFDYANKKLFLKPNSMFDKSF